MIEIKNLSKSFDGFEALKDCSIHVDKGSVYGLVGPNGSGKSTLIRSLTGIYRPSGGTITVDGVSVYDNPQVKARIAYIPDDLHYFASASTRDMMRFYRDMYPNFSEERYNKLKSVFGINEKTPIRRLSKGMQKQSAFWLAMSCCPEILVLDEPVDGLDPVMRRQVWNILLADVETHGTTVLVSSHNLRELEDICDTVGIINHGRIMLERRLDELQDNIVKLSVAWSGEEPKSMPFEVLNHSSMGKLHTFIVRGRAAELEDAVRGLEPTFYDILPLTLEEIFIYELGGEDYAVKEIML